MGSGRQTLARRSPVVTKGGCASRSVASGREAPTADPRRRGARSLPRWADQAAKANVGEGAAGGTEILSFPRRRDVQDLPVLRDRAPRQVDALFLQLVHDLVVVQRVVLVFLGDDDLQLLLHR